VPAPASGAAVARAFGAAGATVAVRDRGSAEAAKGVVSAIGCAGAVLFLASDEAARYVTGQVLEVNGDQFSP
jgi:NAD(P)-dependent dehydrogenase (short-subunit alcohol dehydrogenase family)